MLSTASLADRPLADKSQVVASFDPANFTAPHGREEDWRFTPTRHLREAFSPLLVVDAATVTITTPKDGAATPSEHVVVEVVAPADERLGTSLTPLDLPSALAWTGVAKAYVVTVPRGVELTETIVIAVHGTGTSNQLIRVIVQADAAATVVLDHTGVGTHLTNVEVSVGDRGRLTMVAVADWDDDVIQLGRVHTQLGRDANVTQVLASFGGKIVRLVSTVGFDGPGASVDLLGVFFADVGQHLEHRLFVDHSQPHCRSNAVYKGALQGRDARTVWVGDVLIRANAVGTDTYEINRNLVLTPGARADSIPNLEIETGEITGAGHASATGRFDDEQLFYLQSRGIPPEQARRLVVTGFFADVIAQVPDEELRKRLWKCVETKLRGAL